MNWHTGKKCDMNDPMYGLPEPWRSMDGVKVKQTAGGKISASIPLPKDLSQTLVGSSGVYDRNNNFRLHTAEEIAELSRLNIGAVDVMTREWVMSVGPDGQSDQSTPFVEITV